MRTISSRTRGRERATLLGLLTITLAGAAIACGGEVPAPPAAAPSPAPLIDAVVEEESEHYNFTLESPKVARVGQEAVARLGVTTLDPWHMNLEFPAVLTVDELAGVGVAQTKQSKQDAVHFAEDGAAFEIHFTPDATGRREVEGTLRFAVCQSDACVPSQEKFAFVVEVQGAEG